MTPRRELKRYAKEAMSGKYGTIILGFVAVQALALIGSMVSSMLFPGSETIDVVLGYAFTFILTLLVNVVSAGLNYMYLNIARGKAYSLNDLFYFYKHHPDRVIVASFFLAVLNLLTMLPYTLYGNMNTPAQGASVETQIAWLYTSLLLMLVGMIVFQILCIPLEMSYYILADRPEVTGTEALKESIEMMHGNWGRYLMLKVSYLPLMFLSVFTLYIALLWILPYLAMTETMFYRDLLGEITLQKQEEERNAQESVNPMFGGKPEENQQQFWRAPEESTDSVTESREDSKCAETVSEEPNLQNQWNQQTKQEPSENEGVWDTETGMDEQKTENIKTTPEEEDNEPKPWDEYFNSLK